MLSLSEEDLILRLSKMYIEQTFVVDSCNNTIRSIENWRNLMLKNLGSSEGVIIKELAVEEVN